MSLNGDSLVRRLTHFCEKIRNIGKIGSRRMWYVISDET